MAKNKTSRNSLGSFFQMITGSDFRENTKLITAFGLAIGCWISYGVIIHTQFASSRNFAAKIEALASPTRTPLPEDRERVIIIKDANDMVNQTANTIYTLLTPVAAGITGFFFVASGSVRNKESSEDELAENTDPSTKIEPNQDTIPGGSSLSTSLKANPSMATIPSDEMISPEK